jgi:3-deoxy-D-arabino-heptulosonate 7-phosphate (DAHP) synthase class II
MSTCNQDLVQCTVEQQRLDVRWNNQTMQLSRGDITNRCRVRQRDRGGDPKRYERSCSATVPALRSMTPDMAYLHCLDECNFCKACIAQHRLPLVVSSVLVSENDRGYNLSHAMVIVVDRSGSRLRQFRSSASSVHI